MLTTEIIKHLEIGLGFGHLGHSQRCNGNGKNSFFEHKT